MGIVLGVISEYLAKRDVHGYPVPYCKMPPTVYLRIEEEGGRQLGTILIKLSRRTHPALTDNFVRLCTGSTTERVNGSRVSLAGSSLWSDGLVVGGGEVGDSLGRAAVPSGVLTQTVPSLPASKLRASLAMQPLCMDPNSFSSLFFFVRSGFDRITDGVIFGDVVQGSEVLDEVHLSVEAQKKVLISDCGLV